MKIDDSYPPTAASLAGRTQKVSENSRCSTAGTISTSGSGDKVELSSRKDLLAMAMAAAPVDRSERVNLIKQQVRSGQYQVDPAKVSRAIADTMVGGYR